VPRDASGRGGRIPVWPNELEDRFGQTNFTTARAPADCRLADSRCIPNLNDSSGLAQSYASSCSVGHHVWEGFDAAPSQWSRAPLRRPRRLQSGLWLQGAEITEIRVGLANLLFLLIACRVRR
jgi:hypothetical protein